MTGETFDGDELLRRLNTGVAHPARIYDVWLGGKDNFEADREAAAAGLDAAPATVSSVRANRVFLARAVGYLAREEGIRQFLDIGTGLPSANNTHEVAQAAAPESRVVYVDNDPLVMLHAQVLLTGSAPGMTDYVEADLRDPAGILAQAARTLDFTRPVAVMILGTLHFISDGERPYEIVSSLMDVTAPGSFLAISQVATDILPGQMTAFTREYNQRSSTKVFPRSREEVARFFTGLDLVEPGVVPVSEWHPRSGPEASAANFGWCGVARKPA